MDALTKWSAPVATKVKRRLTFKQFALLALTCVAAVSGSGYGSNGEVQRDASARRSPAAGLSWP